MWMYANESGDYRTDDPTIYCGISSRYVKGWDKSAIIDETLYVSRCIQMFHVFTNMESTVYITKLTMRAFMTTRGQVVLHCKVDRRKPINLFNLCCQARTPYNTTRYLTPQQSQSQSNINAIKIRLTSLTKIPTITPKELAQ